MVQAPPDSRSVPRGRTTSTGSISEDEFEYDYPGNDAQVIEQMDNQQYNAAIQGIHDQVQKIQENIPLLSASTEISQIINEYEEGSTIRIKLSRMSQISNTHCHRSRGDGNCFYRCYAYGLMRFLLEKADDAKRQQVRTHIKNCFDRLVHEFGYPDFTTLDIHENFDDYLQDIYERRSKDLLPETTLESILTDHFNDMAADNYIVCAMRMLTSLGLQAKEAHYTPFLTALDTPVRDIKDFCGRHVEAHKTEADQLQVIALGDILNLSTTVVYADMTPGTEPSYHQFGEEYKEGEAAHIALLYRPGHYDLLI